MPAPAARADPPAPAAPTTAESAPPPDPNVPPPDPNAPAPSPEPGRVNNDVGGFSFVVPPGWAEADASQLPYGSELLRKAVEPGAPPAPTDTGILLGMLDLRLFAGAEPDDTKAAIRLASDMGQFFMPFPGIRINQQTIALNAAGVPGAASYYEVKFTDTTKPDGQIWAATIGTVSPRVGTQAPRNDRWFVVWLGTANDPIDKDAAAALAESIRAWTPPPPPEAPPPDENAPPPPDTNAPRPRPGRRRWGCRFRCRTRRRK